MDSIDAASLAPAQLATSFFNFSAALAWDTTMPDNPADAFAGSLQNTFNFATSWIPR